MRGSTWRAMVLGLAAVGALLFVWRWATGDARRINAALGRIERLVSKRPGESDLAGLSRARQITELFVDRFVVEAEPYHSSTADRRSLAAAVHRYRSSADTVAARLVDRELFIDTSQHRATSHLTAEFITGLRDLRGREAYRFQVNWVEVEGDWRIDYVKLLEVLEGPPRSPLF